MSKFHFASCPIVDWVMKAELGAKKPECKCEEIRQEVAREMFSAPVGANEHKPWGSHKKSGLSATSYGEGPTGARREPPTNPGTY